MSLSTTVTKLFSPSKTTTTAYKTPNKKKSIKQISIYAQGSGNPSSSYTVLDYPIKELGSARYPHYMVYYINETLKVEDTTSFTKEETATLQTGRSANISTSKLAAGIVNNAVTSSIASVNTGISAINTATGGKIGAVTGGAISQWGVPKKRIKQCICLPMPQHIRANYSAGYTTTDPIGAFGAVIAVAIGGADAGETMLMAMAPTAVGAASKVTQAVLNFRGTALGAAAGTVVAAATPSGQQVQQMMSKLSGKVLNKRQEQLFDSMNFRTHSFTYLFIPRTSEESDAISKIIKEFKYHMHPDVNIGDGSSLLITPAEFDIDFRFFNNGIDTANPSISNITTCVLASCDVNYTAIGEFMAFAGTSNPVAIQVDLTFKELEPLTKSMITNGY